LSLPYPNYQIFFTPLVRPNVYGDTLNVTKDIDMTDFIRSGGLQSISQQVDDGDYDIGIFTFGDITLNGINIGRKFNDGRDALSVFPYTRDLCKVEVRLYDDEGGYTVRFRGLVDEQATREDIENDRIRLKVLSMDSVLGRVEVTGGAVSTNDSFSLAIKKVLNVPEITNILNYDESNIDVDFDAAVDNGDFFTAITVKAALDDLLLASNSILIIDKNDNIIVKSRVEDRRVFVLHGRGDYYGRENIISITESNDGRQRAFSAISVNDIEVANDDWIDEYGYRQKSISLDFIDNNDTIKAVAGNILDNFKVPKPELKVKALAKDLKDIELLDTVKLYYDYRVAPYVGDTLPLAGQVLAGQFTAARSFGSRRILPSQKWKVIEIEERASQSEITLKLRLSGNTTADGYFIGFDDGYFFNDETGFSA